MIADLADTIAADMTADLAAGRFVARRTYRPEHSLESLRDLTVIVVPKAHDRAIANRSAVHHDLTIEIAIMQRPDPLTEAALDALTTLVDELADWLTFRGYPEHSAQWQSTACDPIWSQDHLRESQLFTSILTVTYRVTALAR